MRFLVVLRQVFQSFLQAAHAAARTAFGSTDPTPQILHLDAGEQRRETGIRRVKQVMTFVEDVAYAPFRWRVGGLVDAQPILRRLGDDERMVGDDDGRVARAADSALDEADAVMRAGGIDAFAAPVGDFAQRHRGAEEGRKSRAGNIAVGCRADPARDEAERHGALSGRQSGALRRFFKVQQAKIILAPLAHDRLFIAFDGIGIEPCDLLHDLALQVARIGRYPKSRPVLLRP